MAAKRRCPALEFGQPGLGARGRLLQFVGQIVGLHVLRKTRPELHLPFRMWVYPLPSLVALVGWLFVFVMVEPPVLLASLGVITAGCAAFAAWKGWTK